MTALMVRMLGLWVLVMGGAIATPAAAQSPPIEQQLNIRRHQFDRAQALQKAERLMELADRQLDRGQEEAAIAAWRQALELYSSVSDRPGILQAIAPPGEDAHRHGAISRSGNRAASAVSQCSSVGRSRHPNLCLK